MVLAVQGSLAFCVSRLLRKASAFCWSVIHSWKAFVATSMSCRDCLYWICFD